MKADLYTAISDMESWFAGCEKNLSIKVENIPIADNLEWQVVTTPAGALNFIEHCTKRLHKIVSLRAWEPLRNKWVDRCLLEPISEGKNDIYSIIVLAVHQDKYLVQAKGEPGNNTPNRVVITSTVQSSFTNIAMSLSGRCYFTELYEDPTCVKFPIVQDGGQFLNKRNEVCVYHYKQMPKEVPANFYWATQEQITYFAKKGLVSEYLMQALGVLTLQRTVA